MDVMAASSRASRVRSAAVALLLAAAALALYWPVRRHPFIFYDDSPYIYGNPRVLAGLTPAGVRWALTSFHAANWHPLTWLSHMADVTLFGLDAGRHHLAGAVIHAANAALLFAALRGMTAALWPSALVAALFAVHPLHVESVAWAAERKDVLSTFFWLLAILAYVRHARRPGPGRWAALAALYALALMSKPMTVTLPFVLLLLDWWPLGRWKTGTGSASAVPVPVFRLILEKTPLLLMAGGDALLTWHAQERFAALRAASEFPPAVRAANALVSYAAYLGKAVWPSRLAVVYPHPLGDLPPWHPAAALAFLLAVSWLAWRNRSRRPFLAVGWLFYLGTLVPVIGLVQVGTQAMADRYTYVPLTGIFLILAWSAREAAGRWRWAGPAAAALAVIILLALAAASRAQLGLWRDGASLFRHTLAVTRDNYAAHNQMGISLAGEGKLDDALDQFRRALRIRPGYAEARYNAGLAYHRLGDLPRAAEEYRRTLADAPGFAPAHNNLGAVLFRLGRFAEAAREFRLALALDPGDADTRDNLRMTEEMIP